MVRRVALLVTVAAAVLPCGAAPARTIAVRTPAMADVTVARVALGARASVRLATRSLRGLTADGVFVTGPHGRRALVVALVRPDGAAAPHVVHLHVGRARGTTRQLASAMRAASEHRRAAFCPEVAPGSLAAGAVALDAGRPLEGFTPGQVVEQAVAVACGRPTDPRFPVAVDRPAPPPARRPCPPPAPARAATAPPPRCQQKPGS